MRILIVSAHPDDIEFNMGATLCQLRNPDNKIMIDIMSSSETIDGNSEIRKETELVAKLYNLSYNIHDFETMELTRDFQKIRNLIYKIKLKFKPDVIFCTSPVSIHPDHKIVGEACESIFLEQTVYAMEDIRGNQKQLINKWNPITEFDLVIKRKALDLYKSQHKRAYHDFVQIEGLARARGMQVGVEYAEGFEVMREVGKVI